MARSRRYEFSKPSTTPEYRAWINMRSRCNTPSSTGYECYGGRGVKVCPEWEQSFAQFLSDMGPRPGPGYSVDRIDVDGDYTPQNCRWATRRTQSRNLRSNHTINAFGTKMTVAEAAEISGLNSNTIIYRLRRGWTEEQAVSLPLQPGVRPDGA